MAVNPNFISKHWEDLSSNLATASCSSYSQMLQIFIADVNSQLKFNQGGIIKAIPIVIYHNFVTYPDITSSKDAA